MTRTLTSDLTPRFAIAADREQVGNLTEWRERTIVTLPTGALPENFRQFIRREVDVFGRCKVL